MALRDRRAHLFSGILGTGHHYYFIGTPRYWLWVGGVFSALEPLAFLGMAVYAVLWPGRADGNIRTGPRLWTVGCAIMSFVGAGFLGFAHTLPQVNFTPTVRSSPRCTATSPSGGRTR